MIKQIFALLGIILLMIAGIIDSFQGGWKLLVLAVLYAVANTIIFILP